MSNCAVSVSIQASVRDCLVAAGLLFDWLHPQHFPIIGCCLQAWADKPNVSTAVLKFMAEFVQNKTQRLTFDPSSPNGILLFREVSKVRPLLPDVRLMPSRMCAIRKPWHCKLPAPEQAPVWSGIPIPISHCWPFPNHQIQICIDMRSQDFASYRGTSSSQVSPGFE